MEEIQKVPQVVCTTMQEGQSTFNSTGDGSKTTTFLSAKVFVNKKNIEDEKLAAKIANIILETHKEATRKNIIQVVLTYGYDIGIASNWKSNSYSFAPEYLRSMKQLNQSAKPSVQPVKMEH